MVHSPICRQAENRQNKFLQRYNSAKIKLKIKILNKILKTLTINKSVKYRYIREMIKANINLHNYVYVKTFSFNYDVSESVKQIYSRRWLCLPK